MPCTFCIIWFQFISHISTSNCCIRHCTPTACPSHSTHSQGWYSSSAGKGTWNLPSHHLPRFKSPKASWRDLLEETCWYQEFRVRKVLAGIRSAEGLTCSNEMDWFWECFFTGALPTHWFLLSTLPYMKVQQGWFYSTGLILFCSYLFILSFSPKTSRATSLCWRKRSPGANVEGSGSPSIDGLLRPWLRHPQVNKQ